MSDTNTKLSSKEFSTQRVLELACAAFRVNRDHVKERYTKYDNDGNFLYVVHSNKDIVRAALGAKSYGNAEQEFRPASVTITAEDKVEAEEIKRFYRKLLFSAVKGSNEFETEVNTLLETGRTPAEKIGYVSCLPFTWRRDSTKAIIKRELETCENRYLGETGNWLNDLDCKILSVQKSKNYNAWNVLAIVDNCLASWMTSNSNVVVDNAVLIRAKVKDRSYSAKHEKRETRLHYVKIAQ